MKSKIDLKNLDKRIAERMIRDGHLSQEAWQEHLAALPDVGEKAEPISAQMETGILGERGDGR